MTVTVNPDIEHLSYVVDPSYADVEPEGIAFGFSEATGDASGGDIVMGVRAPSGFLYRLEQLQITQNTLDVAFNDVSVRFEWMENATSFASGAALFQSGDLVVSVGTRLSDKVFHLPPGDMVELRRTPLGTTRGGFATLVVATNDNNVLNTIYRTRTVYSFWRQDALQRPGFYTAFLGQSPVASRPFQRNRPVPA